MGLLIDGQWHDQWYDTKKSGGRFVRSDSQFRNWVTADGSAGPTGAAGFAAESGRYHLYVSYACPWAHRTLIARALKGLEAHVGVSVVSTDMLENGWTFDTETGSSGDALFGSDYLHQIYTRADASYSGRVTVPVLWDSRTGTIVSNESADILRMFNAAFDELDGVDAALDLYPEPLRDEIDAINARVYDSVNNGVYKAGFATAQDAYDDAFDALFDSLDWLDGLLGARRYLTGDRLTEADWRLFTTLVRFDAVYHGHFKCNLRRIEDYVHLPGYLRDLYQVPGVAQTVKLDHIKAHYHRSQTTVNPTGIVPKGPDLDFTRPHGRDHLKKAA
jgi:putative glutathione S-transferase